MKKSVPLFSTLTLIMIFLKGIEINIARAESTVPTSKVEINLTFAPLVQRAAPAVVNIYTQKIIRARSSLPLFNDPFFRRFFGNNFQFDFPKQQTRRQNSLGSGVIVSGDGMVVTNKHVIEGADEIRIVLSDRREFDAQVLAMDSKTDLAVLKIKTEIGQFSFLEIKDSDDLEVGDLVLAIGNPFGVGQTVTSGIVSAVARTRIDDSDINAFIQTDAAINPGNSGGALIAMDGRLVGVNTAIFSKSGGSHGIGFAIPSNMVRAVLNGIGIDGKLTLPWLGATGQAVNQDIASSLGLQRPGGVLINAVHAKAAAAKAGLVVGDIVLAVNGHEVMDASNLKHRIATLPVGDVAVLRIWRAGKTRALKVKLAPAPAIPAENKTIMDGNQPLSGATVVNLSPAFAEEHDIDPFLKGVLIIEVLMDTPSYRLRFRAYDIIRSANGKVIENVDMLLDEMGEPTNQWRIGFLRGGKLREVVINR